MIGYIGGSAGGKEDGTATHLHYEIRMNGKEMDPALDSEHPIDPQEFIKSKDTYTASLPQIVVSGGSGPESRNLDHWKKVKRNINDYL